MRAAALRELRERGARNVSMRGLAASLNISPMTAYRYYADKEELFRDLKSEISTRFTDALRAGTETSGEPRAQLYGAGVAYLEFAIANEHEYRLMFDEWLGDIEFRPEGALQNALSWQLLIDLLRRLNPGADDAELNGIGHVIWAALHGLAMLHLAGRVRLQPPVTKTAARQLEMLLGLISVRRLAMADSLSSLEG
ncbi:TetR/AcrR family transcriptional regulator [Sphingomonas sp. BT-65]|uniref:TetR/AcrR family transcriptional regulator n=1 Tax=Sphingomonas sp. BT-65 TaxID=2989821 RepID=UPI002236ABC9|nr:TetR/AcrR family transcriptional regulator [Sphingomonas sp. BT-65]MCW4461197.1 TetR/AcrR family transcriptional regulator [Sphingomonas sp. BT-65]